MKLVEIPTQAFDMEKIARTRKHKWRCCGWVIDGLPR